MIHSRGKERALLNMNMSTISYARITGRLAALVMCNPIVIDFPQNIISSEINVCSTYIIYTTDIQQFHFAISKMSKHAS